jgi:leucyl aminopeptidase (aminopeptidase T)
MIESLDFELGKAADLLVREMLRVKPGENFLITIDSEGDWRVAEAVARVGHAVGAKTAVVLYAAPPGPSREADPYIPEPLKAAIPRCDAWLELSVQYLLYSTPWEEAINAGKTRYLTTCGMNLDTVVRCVAKVNWPAQIEFQTRLTEMTKKARKVKMTSPAGLDVTFENDPGRPIFNELMQAHSPGCYFPAGQIGWAQAEDTLDGTIVFDGSVFPPIGMLREPVSLSVKKSRVTEVKGGSEARIFERWLRKFDDPAMFNVAHVCYGCNPGARLSGNIAEDERVWGCTEWGLGYQREPTKGNFTPSHGYSPPSHTDGICLNASVWLDGVQIEQEGRYIEPELAKLAADLRRA